MPTAGRPEEEWVSTMSSLEIPSDATEVFEDPPDPESTPSLGPEAPEADAVDQAYTVDLDEDDYHW